MSGELTEMDRLTYRGITVINEILLGLPDVDANRALARLQQHIDAGLKQSALNVQREAADFSDLLGV